MSRFNIVAAFALILLPLVASAELYRCPKDGTTVFSDKPCSDDAQPYMPKPIQVVPATKVPDLAKQYDDRVSKEVKERNKADAAWSKDYEAKKQQDETIRNARMAGKVVVGMTQQQVRDLLGDPQIHSRNENKNIVREGWTYKNRDGSRTIVYFKDGIVSSTASKSRQ